MPTLNPASVADAKPARVAPVRWQRPGARLGLLAVLALLAMTAFMTVGVEADWAFVLQHRGTKLAAMVVVVNFFVDLLYAVIDPRVKASDI